MYTHTITKAWNNGGSATTKAISKTAGTEVNMSENIAASQTNLALGSIALDVSQIVSIYIVSSAAIVLKTNSTGSPDNTLTLAAGVPIVWQSGDAATCPLTVDVTALYATTGAIGAAGADLEIHILVDPTI